jgi:hypothetical protein
MTRIRSILPLFLVVAVVSGCIPSGFDSHPAIYGFNDHLATFDVVPPSWITADGKADASQADQADATTAYVFPSRDASDPDDQDGLKNQTIPGVLGSNAFNGGPYQFVRGSSQVVQINTSGSGPDLVISIDGGSLTQIRRLDWTSFRALQEGYLSWLSNHSFCWPSLCFTDKLESGLRKFWKDDVLGSSAQFATFASGHLARKAPFTVASGGLTMYATRLHPRQELSITWGLVNFYPEYAQGGSALDFTTSYSRVTAGATTHVPLTTDSEGRTLLFPAGSCGPSGESVSAPAPDSAAFLPYPDSVRNGRVGKKFLPIYNLFDLHNPRLLRPVDKGCSGIPARYLFLFSPSVYVKPDTADMDAQYDLEARHGNDDAGEESLLLGREFFIVGCKTDATTALQNEWQRIVAGTDPSDGPNSCGLYVNGAISGKTFVEIRNGISVDGRPIPEGILDSSTIGQAVAPALGVRLNTAAAPGSAPLVDLWRASGARDDASVPARIRIRFYTVMRKVLDQSQALEGDDYHVISVSKSIR